MSGDCKSTTSEPTCLSDDKKINKNSNNVNSKNNKVFNEKYGSKSNNIYKDIHSEYTKRRFKHVESKVGRYIANMREEDKRRRNIAILQRHRSLPEAFVGLRLVPESIKSVSTSDIHKLDEIVNGVKDDCLEKASSAATSASSSSCNNHWDGVDKMTHDQLMKDYERNQSYSSHLQSRLDEKTTEIIRLRRNLDFMRTELSTYKDKLKLQSGMLGSMDSGLGAHSLVSSIGYSAFDRHSLKSSTYRQLKGTKETQTDLVSSKISKINLNWIPNNSDANNNAFNNLREINIDYSDNIIRSKTGKTTTNVQSEVFNMNNIREHDACDVNNNEAGIEPAELDAPPKALKRNAATQLPEHHPYCLNCKNSGFCSIHGNISEEILTASSDDSAGGSESSNHAYPRNSSGVITTTIRHYHRNTAITITSTSNTLFRRILRIFGPCVRCNN